MKWEVVKIIGKTVPEFGKWAVYPPGVDWFGGWTDLCDTWEQAQAMADARAHGREVYREADADHAVVPESGYGDDISDNCATCGLATTSDGKRHGHDRE